MKMARQFFLEKDPPEPARARFIARSQSYHGTTLGALSMGGHVGRRAKFEPMLLGNVSRVSPCYPYRHQSAGQSDEAYVSRLAAELDAEFQRLGPETVCAFVAEPVVGAVSRSPSSAAREHTSSVPRRLNLIILGAWLRARGGRLFPSHESGVR